MPFLWPDGVPGERGVLSEFFPGQGFQHPVKAQARSGGNGYLRVHAAHLVKEGVRLKQEVRAEAAKGDFRGQGVAAVSYTHLTLPTT